MFGHDVSDLQSDITIEDDKISGELKYVNTGALARDWGPGYFMVLHFGDYDENATSVKVGLQPSQGSGLVEAINDPDHNGVFKVTNPKTQRFVVVSTGNGKRTATYYKLTGIEFESIPVV